MCYTANDASCLALRIVRFAFAAVNLGENIWTIGIISLYLHHKKRKNRPYSVRSGYSSIKKRKPR